MGQVSVFGGETVKPEHVSWLVTYDDYDYYYYGLTIFIIWIIEHPWDGSTSWIFTMIIILLKPFMWCRTDARLWHVCYLFHLWALYVVSLRHPTEACFMLLSFRGVASDTRSVHSISVLWLHRHVLYEQPACVHRGFCLFRDWHCDHRIFQSMIIICYIIPLFIMFASTFKSTHWLVPGYCLGQISCLERSVVMTALEPKQWW